MIQGGDDAIGGSQDYVGDPRNDSVLISVDGVLTPRDDAKVSVFDSGFVLGDGVGERRSTKGPAAHEKALRSDLGEIDGAIEL